MEEGLNSWKFSLFFVSVPGMALILLVKVQSRVFTAKCSEPQTENSDVGVKEVV